MDVVDNMKPRIVESLNRYESQSYGDRCGGGVQSFRRFGGGTARGATYRFFSWEPEFLISPSFFNEIKRRQPASASESIVVSAKCRWTAHERKKLPIERRDRSAGPLAHDASTARTGELYFSFVSRSRKACR